MARLHLCYIFVVAEYTYVLHTWINRHLIKNKKTTITPVTVINCIPGLTWFLCKREKASQGRCT